MKRLPISLFRFLVLAIFLIGILTARAQQSVVQLPDIYVTSDNYSIHVSHKAGAHPSKVPVLLIHGSWGNAQTWDFPGRSVMDYLAVRGYDLYALDLRGYGQIYTKANRTRGLFSNRHPQSGEGCRRGGPAT